MRGPVTHQAAQACRVHARSDGQVCSSLCWVCADLLGAVSCEALAGLGLFLALVSIKWKPVAVAWTSPCSLSTPGSYLRNVRRSYKSIRPPRDIDCYANHTIEPHLRSFREQYGLPCRPLRPKSSVIFYLQSKNFYQAGVRVK